MNNQPRIIVKPIVPLKVPYAISIAMMESFLADNVDKFQTILYFGWGRRIIDGKKQLVFLAATGNTSLVARKAFKKSTAFGEDIWIIS